MLITPQKLRAMKPEMITKIFLSQVEVLYPKGDMNRQVAEDLGCNPKTVYNWKTAHNVPWAVVMLFQEWIAKRQRVDPLVPAARELAKACTLMAEALQSRADEVEPPEA